MFAQDGPARDVRRKSRPQRQIRGSCRTWIRIGASGWAMVFSVLVGTPGADQGTAWLIATKPPLAWLHSRATPGWRSTSVTSWPSRRR